MNEVCWYCGGVIAHKVSCIYWTDRDAGAVTPNESQRELDDALDQWLTRLEWYAEQPPGLDA
jgi:hypothetical protein